MKSLFLLNPQADSSRDTDPLSFSPCGMILLPPNQSTACIAVRRHGRWLVEERKESSQFETWGPKLASSPLLGFNRNPWQEGRQTDIDLNFCFGGKLETWVRNFELGFKIPAWKHRI
jgi:hypothetical protein